MKKITDSKLISSYKNGNTRVSIFEDGTKIRKYDGEAKPDYPESIDIKISNFCDLSEFCKWCLVPGTQITFMDGNSLSKKNIEDIKKGDKVLSYDVYKKETFIDEVEVLYVRDVNEIIYVIETEEGNEIEITGNHEIFIENKGWIVASEVEVGDVILFKDNAFSEIKSITKKEYNGKVYNFGTKVLHNYFANDILVHNCHEASDKQGKHANLDNFNFLLEQLPPGAELAIGGGNPLSHPNILSFLEKAKDNGIICNMTVNELHLKPFKTLITKLLKEELIKGLGITYSGKKKKELEYFCKLSNNIVFHVIMGVHELSCLDEIQKYSNKVLILGYKEFRKGKTFHSEEVERKKYQWYIRLPLYFDKMILSFDNLSINQLNLKRWFTDKSWNEFFMGEDGTHSMYIDAVSDSFRVSSTGNKHYPIENRNIKEIFSFVQKARI